MEFQNFFRYYKLVIAQIVIILFVIELFFVLWNTHMVQDVIEEVDEQSNATIKIFNTINNTNNDIKNINRNMNKQFKDLLIYVNQFKDNDIQNINRSMNKHFKDMKVHVDDKFNEDRIDDLRIFDILYAKLNKSKMATWGK